MTDTTKTTSPIVIAVAWLVVAIPTAWGVTQSARQAWKLFSAPAPTTAPTTAPAAK